MTTEATTTAPMRSPTCETCRCWEESICRRNPAVVWCGKNAWCGEHSPANHDQPQPEPEQVGNSGYADKGLGPQRKPIENTFSGFGMLRREFAANQPKPEPVDDPVDEVRELLAKVCSQWSAGDRNAAFSALRTGIAAMTKAVPDDEVPVVSILAWGPLAGANVARALRTHGLQITRISGWVK